jgi:hypothetical protein
MGFFREVPPAQITAMVAAMMASTSYRTSSAASGCRSGVLNEDRNVATLRP